MHECGDRARRQVARPIPPASVVCSSSGHLVIHLLEPAPEILAAWLAERGLPAYRAGQVRRWLFERRADSFEDMTDLPKELRGQLAADFSIWTTTIAKHHRAADGTEKLLLELH